MSDNPLSSTAPPSTIITGRNGSFAPGAHQLLNRIEKETGAPAASGGWLDATTGRACTTTTPVASRTATTGRGGRRHRVAPFRDTATSAPRLPAAPPHGPPAAWTSAVVQLATPAGPLGATLGRALKGGAGLRVALQPPTTIPPAWRSGVERPPLISRSRTGRRSPGAMAAVATK